MIFKETLHAFSKKLPLVKINGFNFRQYVQKTKDNLFSTKYSHNEQQRILSSLNALGDSTIPTMKIGKTQHAAITKHLSEKKQFKNLDDVLNLSGIGPKSLEILCDRILKLSNSPSGRTASSGFKLKSTYIEPAICESEKLKIKSVVGLQIDNFYVSWTRFDCETNTVTDWKLIEFINAVDSKHLMSVYQFAISLREKIPLSDVYVIENINWSSHNSQTSIQHHIRAVQTASMLVPLLNGSVDRSSQGDEEISLDNCNKVYFIKASLPTRYFKTLIGEERVSSQNMIEEMFKGNFPSYSSSFSFEQECKDHYLTYDKPSRENLCQSLLLTITFNDVILLNKIESLRQKSRKTTLVEENY